ncbi:hypothetical protein ACFFHM_02460 [Halalkalibacter kiskunsagensis]|uniref:Uncharacterized protein n=1 Tax=Halalkalibacter kiskunsagensis TaxID=1548599 RepID=A0ABV6K7Z7_9BACI
MSKKLLLLQLSTSKQITHGKTDPSKGVISDAYKSVFQTEMQTAGFNPEIEVITMDGRSKFHIILEEPAVETNDENSFLLIVGYTVTSSLDLHNKKSKTVTDQLEINLVVE